MQDWFYDSSGWSRHLPLDPREMEQERILAREMFELGLPLSLEYVYFTIMDDCLFLEHSDAGSSKNVPRDK